MKTQITVEIALYVPFTLDITCAVPTTFHLSKAPAMRTTIRLGIWPTVTAATDKGTAVTPAIFIMSALCTYYYMCMFV